MPKLTLGELAEKIGAVLRGPGTIEVDSCASLDEAVAGQVSFLANPRYADQLAGCGASAVIVNVNQADQVTGVAALIADDPYLAFRHAMVELHGFRRQPEVGVSPAAHVDATAQIGECCTLRPGAYVAPHARIGDRVILYPHVYVGQGAVVGNDCILHPGVCVYDRCVLGDRVILHANTVIGQDGFGYATAPDATHGELTHHKIPQAGNAVIQDDVEIGANCSVDRAALGSTVIGVGSKLSDNVVIGHGVRIGRANLIVAHVGIAGSTTTGDYVSIGGQAGLAGHLSIGHRVRIAAAAKVMHDIPDDQVWGGIPAVPLTQAKRVILHQVRLPALAQRVRDLEIRLAKMERPGSS